MLPRKQRKTAASRENAALGSSGIRRWFLSFGVAAIPWEAVAWWLYNKLLLVRLGALGERFVELIQSGELIADMRVSFIEFVGGFGRAIVIGIGAGVLLAASRRGRHMLICDI